MPPRGRGAAGALGLGNVEGRERAGPLDSGVGAPAGRGTPAGPGIGWGTLDGGRESPAAGVKPLPARGGRAGIPAIGARGRGAKGACSAGGRGVGTCRRRDTGGQAHQRTHLVDDGLAFEGLDDEVVRPHPAGARLVERFEVAGQQQHADGRGGRVGLEGLAHFIPTLAGHQHVGQNAVGFQLTRPGDGVDAVVHEGDGHVLHGKDHPDDFANGERVVGNQQLLRHGQGLEGKPQESFSKFRSLEGRDATAVKFAKPPSALVCGYPQEGANG